MFYYFLSICKNCVIISIALLAHVFPEGVGAYPKKATIFPIFFKLQNYYGKLVTFRTLVFAVTRSGNQVDPGRLPWVNRPEVERTENPM